MKLPRNLKKIIQASPSSPGYVLLFMTIMINILIQGTGFFSSYNFGSIMSIATPLILVSIGQMTIILAGGVDLSMGMNMAFVNAVAIVLANKFGLPIWQSWLIALAGGTLIGFMNGVIVAFIRLPPFLTTFSTMSVVAGLALLVLPTPGGTVPREIYRTYGRFTLGIPTSLWIVAAAALLWIFIFRTPVGKHIRAVGSRERNAYISGINTHRLKLFVYSLGGFYAGCAGLCLTALTGSGDPLIGAPFTLKSIATVILGGTMFDSGWGDIGGTISGSLFFVLVSNIVFFAFYQLQMAMGVSISTFYQDLMTNLIILLGLVSSVVFKRKSQAFA